MNNLLKGILIQYNMHINSMQWYSPLKFDLYLCFEIDEYLYYQDQYEKIS